MLFHSWAAVNFLNNEWPVPENGIIIGGALNMGVGKVFESFPCESEIKFFIVLLLKIVEMYSKTFLRI